MPLVYSWLVIPVCSTVMRSSGPGTQHTVLNALILSTVATCSIQFDIVIKIRNVLPFHLASYLLQVHLALINYEVKCIPKGPSALKRNISIFFKFGPYESPIHALSYEVW